MNQLAIFSDIHGNLVALETVLADLRREGIEQMVCLGDTAVSGSQPNDVLTQLSELGIPIVQGNTDEWLLNPTPFEQNSERYQKIYAIEMWAAEQITTVNYAFVKTFQPSIELPLDEKNRLLCFHGTPRSNTELLRATTPDEDISPMIAEQTATILAGGHTHQQLIRRYQNKLIINPGSVGLPYIRLADNTIQNPPWAEYAVLSWENGRFGIELRQVEVNITAVKESILATDMPHKEWLANQW